MLVHGRVTSLFFFGGFFQRILSEDVEIVCKSSNIVSGESVLKLLGHRWVLPWSFLPFLWGSWQKTHHASQKEFMASQPAPGPSRTLPFQKRPYDQLFIIQWFPLIRPTMKPVFLRGVGWPLDQPGWFRRNRFITLWRNFLEVGSILRLEKKTRRVWYQKRRTKWAPPGNDHISLWVNDFPFLQVGYVSSLEHVLRATATWETWRWWVLPWGTTYELPSF